MRKCVTSYANNKGADQPAHPHSLISAFVVRCLDSIISLDSIAEISRLSLVSVAAQASLCLAWSKTPGDTFCHVVAYLISIKYPPYLLCCYYCETNLDLCFSSGIYCETSVDQSQGQSADPSSGIVAASVIIVIAIIIAIVIYSVWYTRKSRRLKGQYKPSQMEQNGIAPSIPLDKIIDPTNGERLIWQENGGGEGLHCKLYTFLWILTLKIWIIPTFSFLFFEFYDSQVLIFFTKITTIL